MIFHSLFQTLAVLDATRHEKEKFSFYFNACNRISTITCGNTVDKSVGNKLKYCFLLDGSQIAFFVVTVYLFNNISNI